MNQQKSFFGSQARSIKLGRPFVKMHGLRNDFIIVDARDEPHQSTKEEIVRICDRREGIGGDELVIIEPPRKETADPGFYAALRIFNPDGREVEACGNATRCVGWLLLQENDRDEIAIDTMGGPLTCRRAGSKRIAVDMGRLRTGWEDIPLSREMDTLHLGIEAGPLIDPVGMNIGNPHAVFFVDDLDAIDLEKYGPELQKHALFPEEANIGAAQLIDEKTMKLSVWERPGALTTACGTGACAAVGAAHRRGLTQEKRMKVIMAAGSVDIEIIEDRVIMTGPVETCFVGYLPVFD